MGSSLIDLDSGLALISEDLQKVAGWCSLNKLLINPGKTKFMLFGVSQYLSKITNPRLFFLGEVLLPVSPCKDLGITLDSTMSFNDHIKSLTSSLLSTLSQINRVRHLFDKKTLLIILNSLVFSKLFYCSSVWSGTTKQNIHKLQLIQNFAARILTNNRKFDHISPVLRDLGWLSVTDMLTYRNQVMMFKCLNGLVPPYLNNKLVKRSEIHSRVTRQADDINLVKCRTSIAQRSFFYHAAKTWNSLPHSVKNVTSLPTFKKSIKKYLKSS